MKRSFAPGILIAFTILLLWLSHLYYCLKYISVDPLSPFLYIHILLQAYLYTGLFITAHDAIHGTVSHSKKLNKFIIITASFLFAGLSHKKLIQNHHLHHKFSGTALDPDYYHSNNFIVWWFSFIKKYVTIKQFIIMGIKYNLLLLLFPEVNILLFWVIPSILSTFQLFYFGTYLPHRKPHHHDMLPHNARTQNKNHIWAMISCYFFGYHSEHHHHPQTPWWQLYKFKD